MSLRQLPNAITWLRVASALPLGWAIERGAYPLALGVAALAAASDALDGALARRFGWRTDFGSLLDPIADKVLLTTCFVALWWVQALPGWLLAVVLGRDLVIVAGAFAWRGLIGPLRGEPTVLGKVTTLVQLGFVLGVLVRLAGVGVPAWVVQGGVGLVAAVTVGSGIDYVVRWGVRAVRARRFDA